MLALTAPLCRFLAISLTPINKPHLLLFRQNLDYLRLSGCKALEGGLLETNDPKKLRVPKAPNSLRICRHLGQKEQNFVHISSSIHREKIFQSSHFYLTQLLAHL
jgi:hypothetical protein